MGETVFAVIALFNFAPEMVSKKLMTVADAEHGNTCMQDLRIDIGAAGFVNAGGSAGDHEALSGTKVRSRRVARTDVGVDTELADTASNQVSVLAAGIEYRDLGVSNGSRKLGTGCGFELCTQKPV